jgi:hypothetical protein
MQIGDTVIFTIGDENQTQLGVFDDIMFEFNPPCFFNSLGCIKQVKINGIWYLPTKIKIIEVL